MMIDDAEYLALLDGLKTAETLLDDFDAAGLLAVMAQQLTDYGGVISR